MKTLISSIAWGNKTNTCAVLTLYCNFASELQLRVPIACVVASHQIL